MIIISKFTLIQSTTTAASKKNANLLKELLSWCRSIRVSLRCRDGRAERRVPLVVAAGPRQHRVDGRDGCHQVVHRPADDRVVVHAHVDVDHADRVADACGERDNRRVLRSSDDF